MSKLNVERKRLKWFLGLLVVTVLGGSLLATYATEIKVINEIQGSPFVKDPTPGFWETSEYLIGTIAVDIIFLESNGTIDPDTEDWASFEMSEVVSEIKTALDWWEGQSPFVSFIPIPPFSSENYVPVPTGYEPISRNRTDDSLWISETMSYLGYWWGDYITQVRDYVNDLRLRMGADWGFVIFVVDSSNDPDGEFADGWCGYAWTGGPCVVLTYDNNGWGISNMDRVCAHEIAHIFWATDEFNNVTEFGGYLNVSDIEGSGALMYNNSWTLSGTSHGFNGTWGQIGWRDSDNDSIPDVVDTFPTITLNSDSSHLTTNTTIAYAGTATVTPYPNLNPYPYPWNPEGYRSVTINKIAMVEFRIDSGEWVAVDIDSGSSGTNPVENFTFVAPDLSLGNHTVEVRATNQWGNSGYFNETVTIAEFSSSDLNKDGKVNIQDITIVAIAYKANPEDPRWNLIADIDKNSVIDILDITKVAIDYGKTV